MSAFYRLFEFHLVCFYAIYYSIIMVEFNKKNDIIKYK